MKVGHVATVEGLLLAGVDSAVAGGAVEVLDGVPELAVGRVFVSGAVVAVDAEVGVDAVVCGAPVVAQAEHGV